MVLVVIVLALFLANRDTGQGPSTQVASSLAATPSSPTSSTPTGGIAVTLRAPDVPDNLSDANPQIRRFDQVIEIDGWQYRLNTSACASATCVTLVAPLSDDSQGYLVTVLIEVQNQTGEDRSLPETMFVLKDQQQRFYAALMPSKLATVLSGGQPQYLPLSFIIPADATGLILFSSDQPEAGWLVLEQVR
jgi:hypothetical protein